MQTGVWLQSQTGAAICLQAIHVHICHACYSHLCEVAEEHAAGLRFMLCCSCRLQSAGDGHQ